MNVLAGIVPLPLLQKFVARDVAGVFYPAGIHPAKYRLGLTFKKNRPDLRNSKVVDIIRELQS